jgi:hypothetical protein
MGGTCSAQGGEVRYTRFLSENLKGRENLENLSVDERIILKFILRVVV